MPPERQQELAQPQAIVQDVFAPGSAQYDAGALERPAQPRPQEFVVVDSHQEARPSPFRIVLVSLTGVALLIGGVFAVIHRSGNPSQVQAGSFTPVELPLSQFTDIGAVESTAESLKVNGQLEISSSLVLTPTSQPDNPLSGQL